ncbi:MAG: hypothetical protein QOD98_972 [Nocardioidaceae bacterium]|nr:hypothetical protein [Nocardioidaceae bacterium]
MSSLATRVPAAVRPASATTLMRVAAEAAVFSAAIHLWVAPEHLREWWLYGAFFLTAAAAQSLLAWLVLHRASLLVLVGGIWGNLAIIATYVASRTVGLPLTPPHAGHVTHSHLPVAGGVGNGVPIYPGTGSSGNVEAVGTLDLFALSAELVLVIALVGMLPAGPRRRMTNVLLGIGLAVWAIRAVVALT